MVKYPTLYILYSINIPVLCILAGKPAGTPNRAPIPKKQPLLEERLFGFYSSVLVYMSPQSRVG